MPETDTRVKKPSIPIALWFSVLYHLHLNEMAVEPFWYWGMVFLGVIFVVNSLDSLTRLYTQNIGLTLQRLGLVRYVALHWSLLFGLVLLYQFTPLKIEWFGLIVIAIYGAVYVKVFGRRAELKTASEA